MNADELKLAAELFQKADSAADRATRLYCKLMSSSYQRGITPNYWERVLPGRIIDIYEDSLIIEWEDSDRETFEFTLSARELDDETWEEAINEKYEAYIESKRQEIRQKEKKEAELKKKNLQKEYKAYLELKAKYEGN